MSKKFGLWTSVKRQRINASDASSRQIADVECRKEDAITLVIEVKDLPLEENHIKEKLPTIRSHGISESVFVVSSINDAEKVKIEQIISSEFAIGHNIHILTINEFAKAILTIVDENDRRNFILDVCYQLDSYSNIASRRGWADLLSKI